MQISEYGTCLNVCREGGQETSTTAVKRLKAPVAQISSSAHSWLPWFFTPPYCVWMLHLLNTDLTAISDRI